MKKEEINIRNFVSSYLETAAFMSADTDECKEFTRDAKKSAKAHCLAFIEKVKEAYGEDEGYKILSLAGRDVYYAAGNDLFLSSAEHEGFSDMAHNFGGAEISKTLDEIARSMPVECYHVRGKKSKLTF